ncbi:hypothetical protein IAR55_006806 [Kwoniella newhampshirensis]|uniref:Transmembrane protein n=1 Tax=Kwoniella newhampshirensis TaxID=1651941 RepID=A0AAW0YTS1_9TREE
MSHHLENVKSSSRMHRRARRDQSASSAAVLTPFFFPDSSPFITYGAARSSTSPWNAGYARQDDGYDQTLHLTSNSNSTIAFNVSATSFSLLIPAYPQCQATISVNSSTPLPACATESSGSDMASSTIPFTMSNLPAGTHEVLWNSGSLASTDQVVFWGVDGARPADASCMTNVTIDNTYNHPGPVSVTYDSPGDVESWTYLSQGASSDSSTFSEASHLDQDFNSTLAITQTKGAAVTFIGSGSAIYLYGTIGPDYGLASVSVNGQVVAPSLNLTYPWAMSYELLWFQTGLDNSSVTNVTMTNLGSSKMTLDFVVLTADAETVSQLTHSSLHRTFVHTLAGKIVLGVAIPVTSIVLIAAVIIFLILRRRQPWASRARRDSRLFSLTSIFSFGHLWPGEGTSTASPALTLSTFQENLDPVVSPSPTSTEEDRINRPGSLPHSIHTATNYGGSRAGTPLPAYTPERAQVTSTTAITPSSGPNNVDNNDIDATSPTSSTRHPTAEEEKAAQLRLFRDLAPAVDPEQGSTSGRSHADQDEASPSSVRFSTAAPSIMSVFAMSPRSDRRYSAMTDFTTNHSLFHTQVNYDNYSPVPKTPIKSPPGSGSESMPTAPTPTHVIPSRLNLNTSDLGTSSPFRLPYLSLSARSDAESSTLPTPTSTARLATGVDGSPLRSGEAESGSPPSAWSDPPRSVRRSIWDGASPIATPERGRGPARDRYHIRNHSNYSAVSAARPDSDVIPFEEFISGLNAGPREEERRDDWTSSCRSK